MRSATKPIVLVLFTSVLLAAQLRERRIDFEGEETGKPPRFFSPAVTGDKAEGKWVVEDVEGAPSGKKVVTHREGKPDEERYALCLYDTDKLADIDVEVQLKSLSGETDRSGGVVVRCLDRNNYYLARADALDDNVRFYSVVQGKRTLITGQPVSHIRRQQKLLITHYQSITLGHQHILHEPQVKHSRRHTILQQPRGAGLRAQIANLRGP